MSKYGEWKKNYLREYQSKNLKKPTIAFRKEYYESIISPTIASSGDSFATFAKKAVAEKIMRDMQNVKLLCYVRTETKDLVATYFGQTVRWITAEQADDPWRLLSEMSVGGIDDSTWESAETDNINDFFSGSEILAETIILI